MRLAFHLVPDKASDQRGAHLQPRLCRLSIAETQRQLQSSREFIKRLD